MISINYENKFPDCLFMKLHGQLADTSDRIQNLTSLILSQDDIKQDLILLLTIRFGEHQLEVKGGTITFGLKGGALKLNIINGKIPLESLGLNPVLKTMIQTEVQEE